MNRLGLAALLTVGLTAAVVAAAAPSPNPHDLEVPAADLLRAKDLVRRLGTEVYREREAAELELARMGRRATAVLRTAANEDPDPEVRARVGRLLPKAETDDRNARLNTFLADADGKFEHDMPGWGSFKKLIGADKPARELFVEILKSKPALDLLAASGQSEDELTKAVIAYKMQIWQEQNPNAFGRVQTTIASQPRQPSLADVAALLFGEILLDGKALPRTSPFFVYTTQFLYTPNIQPVLKGGNADHADTFRRILTKWFERIADPNELMQVSNLVIQMNLKEAMPALKRAVDLQGVQVHVRAQAISAITKLGGKDELPFLRKFLTDEGTIQPNRFPEMDLQIRDTALAMCVVATGQNPKDYGYEVNQPITDAVKYQYWMFAFLNIEMRAAAFKQWEEWEAKQKDKEKKDAKK